MERSSSRKALHSRGGFLEGGKKDADLWKRE